MDPSTSSLAAQRLAAHTESVLACQVCAVRFAGALKSVPGYWDASTSPAAAAAKPGTVPAAVRWGIVQAPAEWGYPIRADRVFKPAFKACVEVVHARPLLLPIQIQAHLLSEEDAANFLAWDPTPSARLAASQGSATSACALGGADVRSVIIEAGKLQHPVTTAVDDTTTTSGTAGSAWGNGDGMAAHRVLACDASAVGSPVSGQGSDPASSPRSAATGLDGRTGLMISREEFTFDALRFLKPSRMSCVFIAFTCTLQATGDVLVALYRVPTVCTCRSEQWGAACARLGLPANLPPAPPEADRHWHGKLQAARMARGNGHDSSLSTTVHGPGSGGMPLGLPPSGGPMHQPDFNATLLGRPPSPTPAHSMGMAANSTDSSHGSRGGGGRCTGRSSPTHTAVSSDGTPPVASSPALPFANGHGAGLGLGGGLMMQQGLVSPAQVQASDVKEWCRAAFANLGLQRGLSLDDLEALAAMSGVYTTQGAQQAAAALAQFQAQFSSLLGFMPLIASLWNSTAPCIVAGFSVNREAASRLLVSEPPGTFLCRLSMSSGVGGLALAVQTGGRPGLPAGPDGVMNVLITVTDLANRDVRALLRGYNGTTHLLDVYTRKRLDKRMVFASDYMRLGDVMAGQRAPNGLGSLGLVSGGASGHVVPQVSVPQHPAAAAVPAPAPSPGSAGLHVAPGWSGVQTVGMAPPGDVVMPNGYSATQPLPPAAGNGQHNTAAPAPGAEGRSTSLLPSMSLPSLPPDLLLSNTLGDMDMMWDSIGLTSMEVAGLVGELAGPDAPGGGSGLGLSNGSLPSAWRTPCQPLQPACSTDELMIETLLAD